MSPYTECLSSVDYCCKKPASTIVNYLKEGKLYTNGSLALPLVPIKIWLVLTNVKNLSRQIFSFPALIKEVSKPMRLLLEKFSRCPSRNQFLSVYLLTICYESNFNKSVKEGTCVGVSLHVYFSISISFWLNACVCVCVCVKKSVREINLLRDTEMHSDC